MFKLINTESDFSSRALLQEPASPSIIQRKPKGFDRYISKQKPNRLEENDPADIKQPNLSNHTDNNNQQISITKYHKKNTITDASSLKRAIDQQKSFYIDTAIQTLQLGEIMLHENLISQSQLQQALDIQKNNQHYLIGKILKEMGLVSAEIIQLLLAKQTGMPFINLDKFKIAKELRNEIPFDIAFKHLMIPLFVYHDRLVVAMSNINNDEAHSVLKFISPYSIDIAITSETGIKTKIATIYGKEKIHYQEIVQQAEAELDIVQPNQENTHLEINDAERLSQEKPVVRMVNAMIIDAINKGASDIHIRPQDKSIELLFRLDGSMLKVRNLNKNMLPAIVSRIKVISGMDISEHRLPQDGHARVTHKGQNIDLRISIIPLVTGESVVLRLFNNQTGIKPFTKLGFNKKDQESLHNALHNSYGMILVTGPTGSGKSTTLYSALNEISQRNLNIITVEDPVEYHIPGIEQIQAKPSINFTFAKALKNILRHDPDVIMLGEIRDQETGQIAVDSSLTGHLVLSTLHTNNAASTVTRLVEMGIKPYAVSSTLLAVISQQLVKSNCPHCLKKEDIDPISYKALNMTKNETFYKGKGCDHCNYTGYHGRIAIFELLNITHAIQLAIMQVKSTEEIKAIAISEGMTTLTENAINMAKQGKTSLAEVYRIVQIKN